MANSIETSLNNILSKVANVFNLEHWKHSLLQFEDIGQNYFGILVPLVISGRSNRKEETHRLVLKLAPQCERYRVSGAVTAMFAREIFAYTKLLNEYRASQEKLNLDSFAVPSCYYVCPDYCREVVVLQDMTAEGFKPVTKTMFLDNKHTIVSLKSLAIFHAYSFILRKMYEHLYDEATKVCVPLSVHSNKRFMEVLEDRLKKAINCFEDTMYLPLFKNFKENYVKLVESSWDSVGDTCICHGDIWKENILFKYEGAEPVSACLIDFQTARVSSPAYDVLYLITSSTDADTRTHFRNFIDSYYEQFDRVLRQAGLDSRQVYSRDMLDADLKTVAPACFVIANTALWLASGCQQEGHVRSKRVLNMEERKVAMESYRTIMEDIIKDFVSYGYFRDVLLS